MIQNRSQQLQERLEQRNQALNEFMQDGEKLRSYLVRSSQPTYGHGRGERGYELFSKDDISSEEKEEVDQMCRRIFEIEQELRRLALVAEHIEEKRTFELEFKDLISYGFDLE